MLKQRVITALILIPLVVWAVLWLPNGLLGLLLGVVVLLGAKEWAILSGLDSPLARGVFMLAIAIALVASQFLRQWPIGLLFLMAAAALWWLAVLVGLYLWKPGALYSGRSWLQVSMGPLVLVPSWLAMVQIHASERGGPALLLLLMVLIWVADSAAYFSGRRWGRVKLAPSISPGKTLEGLYGALVGMVLFSLVLWYWGGLAPVGWFALMLLSMVTGLFSVVGDLFESLIKRQRGVKDSGSLLPGHGGVLDRIDSLTAAAPIFLFGLMLLGAA